MGIEYQQNLAARNLVVLVLQAKSSRLEDLRTSFPALIVAFRESYIRFIPIS